MALAFDLLILLGSSGCSRRGDGWRRMSGLAHPVLASFSGAIEFIFTPQTSNVTGGKKVGGLDQVIELTLNQLELTVFGLLLSLLIALPARPLPGPPGRRRDCSRSALGNAGRAIPSWR